MKRKSRFLVMLTMVIAIAGTAHATTQDQESSDQKIKPFLGALWPWGSKKRKKPPRETPTPSPTPSPSASPQSSDTTVPDEIGTPRPSPTASSKQTPAANATISAEEISDYEGNLPEVR